MIEADFHRETERLILRRFTMGDIGDYLSIFQHPDVANFLPELTTRSAASRQMAMVEGHWHLVGLSMFAVEEKASGKMIGRVGPWMPDERTEPEIGWAIHPDFGRRGYAVEAAKASLDIVKTLMPNARRVVHLIEAGNIGSQRTAQRLGAALTQEVCDHPEVGLLQVWATPLQH